MKYKHIIIITLFQICLAIPVHAETVYLSVAASMTDAFKEIIAEFSAKNSDAELRANFASSGSLAKQINQGAPADIYVSANPKWMRFLKEKKMIAENTDHIFAYNSLVFVGVDKMKNSSLETLPDLQRIAIGSPSSVPAGQYAKQAMQNAGIYEKLVGMRKLVMAKDVRQALLYADRQEVDGAFVYRTDALLARSAKILFTVPEKLYDKVSYPLALTIAGAKKDTAQAFYSYMNSPDAGEILGKYGFIVP